MSMLLLFDVYRGKTISHSFWFSVSRFVANGSCFSRIAKLLSPVVPDSLSLTAYSLCLPAESAAGDGETDREARIFGDVWDRI